MSKPKMARKLDNENLRVKLILNAEKSGKRSWNFLRGNKKYAAFQDKAPAEYTYHFDRILGAVVVVVLLLAVFFIGVRALFKNDTVSDTSAPTTVQATTSKIENIAESAAPALTQTSLPLTAAHSVVRAVLAEKVENREPNGLISHRLVSLNKLKQPYIYFFTEVKGLTGKTIYHVWKYQGKVIARVDIRVGDALWRSYSGRRMRTSQLGSWEVDLVDDTGVVLTSRVFNLAVR